MHYYAMNSCASCTDPSRVYANATVSFAKSANVSLSSEPLSSKLFVEDISTDMFGLRQCNKCSKLRLLGGRACTKYPSGFYKYNNSSHRFHFECSLLFGVTCDTPPDVLDVEDWGDAKLVLAFSYKPSLHCFLLNVTCQCNNVIVKAFSGASLVGGHNFLGGQFDLRRATGTYFKFSSTASNSAEVTCPDGLFLLSRIDNPLREAICCTPFHDMSFSNRELNYYDVNEEFCFKLINRTKEIHFVLEATFMFICSKCSRSSVALPEYSEILTPVGNGQQPICRVISDILNTCDTFQQSLQPCSSFQLNPVPNENCTFVGVCTQCAQFYAEVDGSAKPIYVRPVPTPASTSSQSSSDTSQDEDSQDDPVHLINKCS